MWHQVPILPIAGPICHYNGSYKFFFAYTSYLEMLQKAGPSERIFKEIQKIEILDFEHRDEKHPMDNVENLCENMHFYPPERYLGRVCLASWLVCVPSCG